jgi:transposase-like protein
MPESKKRQYTSQEKVKIVLAMLKGENTQNELTSRYGIHATQLYQWKKQVLDALPGIFATKKKFKDREQEELIDELYRQIGELKVQLDWMKKKSELFN